MSKYYWHRTVMNGYEPDNRITFTAELIGNEYRPFRMTGSLYFRDGSSFIIIRRDEEGRFYYKNDDHCEGIANSFEEAWQHMPALITNPDHWEESEIYESPFDI